MIKQYVFWHGPWGGCLILGLVPSPQPQPGPGSCKVVSSQPWSRLVFQQLLHFVFSSICPACFCQHLTQLVMIVVQLVFIMGLWGIAIKECSCKCLLACMHVLDPASWIQDPALRILHHGSWILIHNRVSCSPDPDSTGSWMQDRGSRVCNPEFERPRLLHICYDVLISVSRHCRS